MSSGRVNIVRRQAAQARYARGAVLYLASLLRGSLVMRVGSMHVPGAVVRQKIRVQMHARMQAAPRDQGTPYRVIDQPPRFENRVQRRAYLQ